MVNEQAINAVRDDRTVLTAAGLSAARDRVLLRRRDTSNAPLPEERRSVAVHALVAALCEHADPVAKVTTCRREWHSAQPSNYRKRSRTFTPRATWPICSPSGWAAGPPRS
ncbi:hypothetical protein [Amycolatopsis sp. DSM 110486]|uniref:hypothetical protein n=1 Tax=Amycolatopsis sp. DSM 110486 TaxID=2865832 RepID=UPI0021078099|nr:hypothetical protein [Amycolatopsis sp. DSM 110486]